MKTESLLNKRRTHTCGELRPEQAGETVTLMGWVHKRRDLGGLIFLDLRDRYGLTQCMVSPERSEIFAKAEKLRSEYVIAVTGEVLARPEGSQNKELATGGVEISVTELTVLNSSKTPPIPIADDVAVDEFVRLEYRYLDLRRRSLADSIVTRHRLAKACRDFLDQESFLEIETPTFVRSTPEGARDYLVPSRVYPGCVYALPQSPQLFKQLLMVSGMDRYFQLARCFRDEDLRADRQPEFTQIDMEMSFVGRDDVLTVVERMLKFMIEETLGKKLSIPFARMSHAEALDRYGIDKPDLRFGLPLVSTDDLLAGTDFGVFENTLKNGGVIRGLKVPGQGGVTRKIQTEWDAYAKERGLGGLFFVSLLEDGSFKSSIAKFLSEEQQKQLVDRFELEPGDLAVLSAGGYQKVSEGLGKVRLFIGNKLELIDRSKLEFLWVLDFPLFSLNEETGNLEPEHHPFTSVHSDDEHLLETEPLKARADSYDLVLNGYEMASGSVRIHRRELQEKVLELIGMDLEEARQKFGFLLKAFEYGAPPHAGIALGFDRLTAVCMGYDSIRDVIAFPKNANAFCPLTEAPVVPDQEQLDVLHLKSTVTPKVEA